jgi:tetratricopeptide (TPR) repeat protein
VLGDLPRGIDAYELWESLYPRDVIPVENLGNIFDALGEPEKALALEQKAIRMRPDGSMRYALLAWAELEAGRYPALNRLCTDPKYTHAEQVLLHVSCYLAAFAQHDTSAMQPQLAWGQGKAQQSVLLEFAAWAEMSTGRLADARHTFAEARDSAARNNMIDFAAGLDTDEAWLDADLGFTAQARARATEALKSASDLPDMQASAALALARSGDTSGADAAMARVSAPPRATPCSSPACYPRQGPPRQWTATTPRRRFDCWSNRVPWTMSPPSPLRRDTIEGLPIWTIINTKKQSASSNPSWIIAS